MELWLSVENYGIMEKKYGTMDKTMILYRELWTSIYEGKKHAR